MAATDRYCVTCACPLLSGPEGEQCTAERCWCEANVDQAQEWHALAGEA